MKRSHRILLSEDDFARDLAGRVVTQNQPMRVTAKEEDYYPKSPLEEATEHAKIYWMMGWTWEEIEDILEQMEFPENTISGAVKAAKKYATDIMKEGPFRTLKAGQLIKLKNGFVGKLVGISKDEITVECDDDLLKVEEKDINPEATQKLLEAFTLKQAANQMLVEAQEKYLIPTRPEKYEETRVVPKGKEPFKTTIKPSPGAPPEWGKETPHMKDVIEVSTSVGGMLDNIEAAEELLGEVNAELKPINVKANEIRGRRKELQKEQLEIAQNIFAIIGSENKELKEMRVTVFRKYKNKLIGLKRNVVEIPEGVGPIEELDALRAILEANHPRIFNKVMAALEEYREVNTTISEQIDQAFAYYPPAEKKISRRAQLWQRLKSWAKKTWAKIAEVAEDLWDTAFPAADESVSAIDEFYIDLKSKAAVRKAKKIASKMSSRKLENLTHLLKI